MFLDASTRKAAYLRSAIATCGWADRVQVLHGRAEDAGRLPELRGRFELVVARAFGPPPVTAECAAPFLELRGLLVVSEPPAANRAAGPYEQEPPQLSCSGEIDDARWPREGLVQTGLEPVFLYRGRFGYQVLRQVAECPPRFPRRAGVPAKRPLYRLPGSESP